MIRKLALVTALVMNVLVFSGGTAAASLEDSLENPMSPASTHAGDARAHGEIPNRITDQSRSGKLDSLLWLAADEVIRDEEITWAALPSQTQSYLELAQRLVETRKLRGDRPTGDCFVELSLVGGETKSVDPDATIEKLAENARRALLGRIVALRPGFLRGNLGTVFALEAAADTDGKDRTQYFFYPVAKLEINGAIVCFGQQDSSADRLSLGQDVALLLQETERPQQSPVLAPLPGELVVRTRGDVAHVIGGRLPTASFTALAAQLKSRAAAEREVPR